MFKKIKRLLITILASMAITLTSCAGLSVMGDNYKCFSEVHPEIAKKTAIMPLGETVMYQVTADKWAWYMNVMESKHPVHSNYLIFIDTDAGDGDLNGDPDFAMLIIVYPNGPPVARAVKVETAMDWISRSSEIAEVTVESQLHKRKLNRPKNWKNKIKHKNRKAVNNTVDI